MVFDSKRGYFFLIDALIGSTIIIFALLIILASGSRSPNILYDYTMAEEISQFFINTRIQDINNPYILNLTVNGIIKNTQYTLIEQIDEFHYYGNDSYATGIVRNISDVILPKKYGLNYSIHNPDGTIKEVYIRSADKLASARTVIVSKKITFLQINETVMFGPSITEIKIWI